MAVQALGATVGQGVTVGVNIKQKGTPVIRNRVYIGSGAQILGPVTIGDEVIIGANAVVLKDIPSNSVAGGVPAKIIKRGINTKDYLGHFQHFE